MLLILLAFTITVNYSKFKKKKQIRSERVKLQDIPDLLGKWFFEILPGREGIVFAEY